MLYIVLVLVVAALALLVTALITATSLWAWISIGLSVLAGLLLLVDWIRRRRSSGPEQPPADEAEAGEPDRDAESESDTEPEDDGEEAAEQTELLPATGELSDPAPAGEPDAEPGPAPEDAKAEAKAVRDTPPGEEDTAEEDLELVRDLEDEVVVVDEYPRYHLVDCGWLSGRDSIPIAVGEARQLGFSPCARCGPDAVLAAAHR
ncbi:hypothetical protein [Amycolatopsis jiangsuensis]|uniref:Cytoskeletal protein RodZ n=1 Tax=Amycolatopsis jiangsuensis TaxID=1181879 RepID=A0A840ILJ8_9PSEU|nr:hypothetical protein [Amycolatopsis jiangsuensis]MBB4682813.1 cytoskeletal protein RodZ [Amycolatopsis jiangsuensis]